MNPPTAAPPFHRLRRFLLIVLCAWFALVVFVVNKTANGLQAASPRTLPFGVFDLNGVAYTQDFSYNLLYFRGIAARLVPHPYRLRDQERLMRHVLPNSISGMSHAYSPVAFVLLLPLLDLSGRDAYAFYTAVCAVATLLLFHFYLFPRATEITQLGALMLCALGIWVMSTFAVGQTAPITTAAVALFWTLLNRRDVAVRFVRDVELAALFWMLCLKPSVALLPVVLLLGARAWRPFALGLLMLALTWAGVCGHYGGFWTGLGDYLHLLDHYTNGAFPPFMQRGTESVQQLPLTNGLFTLKRDLVLLVSVVLLFLRWSNRITNSGLFQGIVWNFVLFSPYLLPTENWILVLLVVEGSFFLTRGSLLGYGKLALLCALFHLRAQVNFPIAVDFGLKCVLAAWCLVETQFAAAPKNPETSGRPVLPVAPHAGQS